MLVLCGALLRAIYDEKASQQIEDWIKKRAKSALSISDGGNLITKIPLFVSGKNRNLVINEIDTDEGGGAINNQAIEYERTDIHNITNDGDMTSE